MNGGNRAVVAAAIALCASVLFARDARADDPPDASAARPTSPEPLPVRVTFDDAVVDLWPRARPEAEIARCESESDPVECVLRARWAPWPEALDVAVALWRDLGTVCGVERAQTFNGSYRGMVHLVPAEPVGRYAQQLVWVDRALRDQDAFYRGISSRSPRPIAYRWTGVGVRFHRTVNTHTPAAYAYGWTFAYNVEGRINDSLERIRQTLIHEVFHSNDQAHGDWSHHVLRPVYDAILAHCGLHPRCLRPYAPSLLRVRRTGMYYSFQPGNSGVGEYAATLAERFYLEASGQWSGESFKCGNADNARAWQALVDEFFGGFDPVRAC